MSLANGVVLVHGYRRSALYDLHGGRVQRIPSDFARLLECEAVSRVSARDKKIIEYLSKVGFYIKDAPPFYRSFRVDHDYPMLPRFHTVSADMKAFKNAAFIGWLEEGLLHGWIKHVVAYEWGGRVSSPKEVSEICAEWRVSGATACFESDRVELALINNMGEVMKVERLPFNRRAGPKLAAGIAQYTMLKHTSELAGQLYVDEMLSIWPDTCERHYCFGNICSDSLGSLMASPKYLKAFTNVKSERQVCSDCELRYCCFYPFSLREVASDISSAPLDCGYRPRDDSWQSHAFVDASI